VLKEKRKKKTVKYLRSVGSSTTKPQFNERFDLILIEIELQFVRVSRYLINLQAIIIALWPIL